MYWVIFDDGDMINLDIFERFTNKYDANKEIVGLIGYDKQNNRWEFDESKAKKIKDIIRYHQHAINELEEMLVWNKAIKTVMPV